MSVHHIERFSSFEAWKSWVAENRQHVAYLRDLDIEDIIRKSGIKSRVFGHVPADKIVIEGTNLRETVCVNSINTRLRAVLELLTEYPDIWENRDARIYAPEAMTALALYMRGRFAKFIGSEYCETEAEKAALFPVQHEDLMSLSFPDAVFDCVLTNDVLEHVPDINKCLAQMHRIIRPGGLMMSTFPFTWKPDSIEKAGLVDGKIEFFCEPEYHVNPINDNGSLVFTIPGWQILDQCRDAGFAHAEMAMIASEAGGLYGGAWPYLNVLVARR